MTSRSRTTLLTMVGCPDCGLPAEILDRFSLDSTDGSIEHIALACIDGHYFRMPADRVLAEEVQADEVQGDRVQSDRAAAACLAAGSGAQPSGPALSRLPGRLGIVGTPPAIETAAAVGEPAAVRSPVAASGAATSQLPAAARAGIAAAGTPQPPPMADPAKTA
jgi:hypothetical protein